ncbi:MAG: Hpt domain-containing protein, partial [Mariprofundaceae bacterium]|nr:Hpt domain-containing protein [Mariprofundaceae bacterium]
MSGFDLSNFLASFFDEARERLNSINQALVKFESGNLTEEGMVALRRDAHTIKGSALMLGVTDIGETAHLFEDMMEQLMEHSTWKNIPAIVQFLYDIHDALDDRLKDTDSGKTIDVPPLRTKQTYLLAHLDEDTEANSDIEDTASNTEVDQKDSVEVEDDASQPLEEVEDSDENHEINLEDQFLNLDAWLQSDDIELEQSPLNTSEDVDVADFFVNADNEKDI